MGPAKLRAALAEQVASCGLDAFAVAKVEPLPRDQAALDAWLARGYHRSMAYMEKYRDARNDPTRLLPGCRSVVMLALNYGPGADGEGAGAAAGQVARYARGRDYHKVLGKKLKRLAAWLQEAGGEPVRSFVDTGPVLERAWAQRAGLGWIGKNANLIRRDLGSWILLGELLSASEIEPDPEPHGDFCGSCTACITDCPTGAIVAPGVIDSGRCIAYWNIEHRGSIPEPMREAMGDRIFGCDDCQLVCPWTRTFGKVPPSDPLSARQDLAALDPLEILAMAREQFLARFAGTPVMRARLDGMKRNACIVLGNSGNRAGIPALRQAASDPDPMIREHAAWALRKLDT
jgi:epoxyqueuosine reductase